MNSPRPAKFGPYHRRSHHNPIENELIAESGSSWGKPRGNYYAGIVPCVKAWDGPLLDDVVGTEFYTDVEPIHGLRPAGPNGAKDGPVSSFWRGTSWSPYRLLLP
jgi:hypothetical protein